MYGRFVAKLLDTTVPKPYFAMMSIIVLQPIFSDTPNWLLMDVVYQEMSLTWNLRTPAPSSKYPSYKAAKQKWLKNWPKHIQIWFMTKRPKRFHSVVHGSSSQDNTRHLRMCFPPKKTKRPDLPLQRVRFSSFTHGSQATKPAGVRGRIPRSSGKRGAAVATRAAPSCFALPKDMSFMYLHFMGS